VESFVEQHLFQGIFAVTDNYANQIIEILNRYQVKVPEDVQIIGFDGSRSSKNEKIRLSTIRQNVELLATTAVELLIDAITTDNNVQAKKIIPVDFIQGETTKN
ncbi:MAG: substrate-binding domain-containing protein, partial [Culicoidibacterales bacterium]